MFTKNGSSGGQWYLVGIILGGILFLALPHLIFAVRALFAAGTIIAIPVCPFLGAYITRYIINDFEEQERIRSSRWYDPPRRPSFWRLFAMRRVW